MPRNKKERVGRRTRGFLAMKDFGCFHKVLLIHSKLHYMWDTFTKKTQISSTIARRAHPKKTNKKSTNIKKGSNHILGGNYFNFRYGTKLKLGHCML